MRLDELRKKIDKIDDKILRLLKKREECIKEIIDFKIDNDIDIKDNNREKKIKNEIKKKCEKIGLDETFASKIFDSILKNSCKMQKRIKDDR